MSASSNSPGGSLSDRPQRLYNWEQDLTEAGPLRFHRALEQALGKMDSQEYHSHLSSREVESLSPGARAELARALMALSKHRGMSWATAQPDDPDQMSPEQIVSLLEWACDHRREALVALAAEFQRQPDVLHALLGPATIHATLAALGVRPLTRQLDGNE